MSEYVIEKYAPTLTAEDMLHLFSIVVEFEGSITKAATKCDITRRSYYMIEKRAFIQPNTKEKILGGAYELSPNETLEYLLKRHIENSLEVLLVNLSKIYEQAVEESDREVLVKILEQFDRIRKENEGLILDQLQREVADQIVHLRNKAEISEIRWKPSKASMLKVQEIISILPLIQRALKSGKDIEDISEKYRIDQEIIQVVSDLNKKEKVATLKECSGFLYGYEERQNPDDYWREQIDSAAGVIHPAYMIRCGERDPFDHQTETTSAVPLILNKERV